MSRHEHSHGIGNEHPRSHEIQLFGVILFLIIWIADSFVLKSTAQLANDIPLVYRIIVFVILVVIAYRLANGSHKLVLRNVDINNPRVVEEDVYKFLRHPMYFAEILAFIALIQLTMSLISTVPLLIAFFLLNLIAAYEEKELTKILGQKYVDYMKRVPRWIPNLFVFFKKE